MSCIYNTGSVGEPTLLGSDLQHLRKQHWRLSDGEPTLPGRFVDVSESKTDGYPTLTRQISNMEPTLPGRFVDVCERKTSDYLTLMRQRSDGLFIKQKYIIYNTI